MKFPYIFDLAEVIDKRSEEEQLVFRVIEGVLLTARLWAIVYFVLQTVRHSRYQGDKKDPYTFATFLFLGLSLICFFANRFSQLVESTLHAIFQSSDPTTD